MARWGVSIDTIGKRIDTFQAGEISEANSSPVCPSLPIRPLQLNRCAFRDATKRKSYFDQACSMETHVIFMQETMRRLYGISEENGFIMASSSADSGGHGGCMVAISVSLSFAPPVEGSLLPSKVSRDDVNILCGDHRMIIVRVSAPRFQSICVSVHGLDCDHGKEIITEKWRSVGDQFAKCIQKGDSVCCGVDGNARVGRRNNNDLVIGDLLDSETRHDFVSEAMIHFARRFGLRMVNTYTHLNGDAGTCVFAYGKCYRTSL